MNRSTISLSLLSASVVAFEIQLMHVFSVVQWTHFATMFISIALLGFGASGTFLSLFRKRMTASANLLVPLFMIITGIFMSISIPLSRTGYFLFDSYTLFVDKQQFGRLAANYLLFFLPFFFAGAAIGLLFMKNAARIGRYYFADLLGAGVGGILAIALMWNVEFDRIPLFISTLPILAGWVCTGKGHWSRTGFTALFLLALFVLWNRPIQSEASPYKSIRYALQLPEARIEQERHSPYGLVQVVSSPQLRYAPGLSLTYQKQVFPGPVLYKNGNWHSAIPVQHGSNEAPIMDFSTMALPYRMRSPDSVLQLGAGAGMEVSQALANGVKLVEALEPDAMILSLLRDEYAMATDSLYHDPRTVWHTTNARVYLERTRALYDLIQLPLLGSFGGSVGLNALEEDHVLTEEGFSTLWKRLGPKGMIAVSCWIEQPQKMSLKLAALIQGVMEQEIGTDPMAHLLAVKSWGTLSFVLSKSPISQREVENVKKFCEANQFDLVNLEPSADDLDTDPYNVLQNKQYLKNLRTVFGDKRDSLLARHTFNIAPPTENRPYFFQFLKLKKIPEQRALLGETKFAFSELGYLILLVALAQVVFSALVFILIPLFKLGWKGGEKSSVVLYFSALGLGYMFVEIVLIKYFSLYLAHPIYAVSAVISILLISSGLGSRYSERFGLNKSKHQRSLLKISLLILIYVFFIGAFLGATVGFPMWSKVALSLILIGIPGFFMGMPFPLGLKKLEFTDPSQIPWAWGINGCVSVISSILAALLAVELGFILVCLLGTMAYLIAYLSLKFLDWPG